MNDEFDKTLDHRKDQSYRWEQPFGRDDVIGMGTADMDFYCPPCVREASQAILEQNTFNYQKKPESYFQAVLGWYQRKYGLSMEKEWLSDVPGTIGSIRIALGLFAQKNDFVIMQAPQFGPLQLAIEGAGCQSVLNPMILKDGRYELDFEDFEEKIKQYHPSIYLMVNPHNPTGKAFTQEELTRLVDLCEKYNVLILSDEVHSLILYEGRKHIPILSVSETACKRSIQVMSMSKGFNLMSLPHAIISIANPELRSKWEQELISYSFDYAVNSYSIAAVTAVMSGAADDWLTAVTQYLQNNLNEMITYLQQKKFPVTPIRPDAGFLLWLDCRKAGIDGDRLAEAFFEQAGIRLNNGTEYGTKGNGFVRLNFAVTNANLKSALKRMEKVFAPLAQP